MSTIAQELNQLEQAINQNLTSHREQLTRQQAQILALTQLLNSRGSNPLDAHCVSAIDRLIELFSKNQQSTDRVQQTLTSLIQAKDAPNLTLDKDNNLVTSMDLEVSELAQRLGLDSVSKLSAAARSSTMWAKLMNDYPDPDNYRWERPTIDRFKLGFYHLTQLKVTGTKPVKLVSGSALN